MRRARVYRRSLLLAAIGGLFVLGWRFWTGAPLDGQRRTDATWLVAGTRPLDGSARATRWSLLPRWQRAAWRLVAVIVALVLLYGHIVYPGATRTALRVATAAGVLWLGFRLRRWRLHREITEPLAAVLRAQLGADVPTHRLVRVPRVAVDVPPTAFGKWFRRARVGRALIRALRSGIEGRELAERIRTEYLIRRDRRNERLSKSRPVRIALPHTWPGPDSKIVAVAATRLGGSADEWAASWNLRGSRPSLELRVAPKPPGRALWADYLTAVEMSGPTELMLGPTAGLRPVRVDLDSDVPHILLSMGTGAGKSVCAKCLGMQALRKGWAVIVLDLKQESHPWAKELLDAGVPGITYCRKVEEVHDALLWLNVERDNRADRRWYDKNAQFQRVIVIMEELNLTATELRDYWQSIKQKGDAAKSPALSAMGKLTQAGRSVGMHVLAIGQMLTAQTMGGPEARENFGARILGRYTVNNWKMLVPEVPFVRSSKIRGRVQVCIAGASTATQVLFATDDEAVEYASGGVDAGNPPGVIPFRMPSDVPHVPVGADTSPDRPEPGGQSPAGDAPEPAAPRRLTLEEACEEGILPMTYAAAKKARTRDLKKGTFPKSEDYTYTADELLDWYASRPRAVA
jgi:hypothetical protein